MPWNSLEPPQAVPGQASSDWVGTSPRRRGGHVPARSGRSGEIASSVPVDGLGGARLQGAWPRRRGIPGVRQHLPAIMPPTGALADVVGPARFSGASVIAPGARGLDDSSMAGGSLSRRCLEASYMRRGIRMEALGRSQRWRLSRRSIDRRGGAPDRGGGDPAGRRWLDELDGRSQACRPRRPAAAVR